MGKKLFVGSCLQIKWSGFRPTKKKKKEKIAFSVVDENIRFFRLLFHPPRNKSRKNWMKVVQYSFFRNIRNFLNWQLSSLSDSDGCDIYTRYLS